MVNRGIINRERMSFLKFLKRFFVQIYYDFKKFIRVLGKKSCKPRKTKPDNFNRMFLSLVNKDRRKRGLKAIYFDETMKNHAYHWSAKMAKDGHLSHSGYALENACMVPYSRSSNTIAKRMFYCWKGSPRHWAWMMNSKTYCGAVGYRRKGRYAYGAFAFKV